MPVPKRRNAGPRLCTNPNCNKHVKGHANKRFCRAKCKDRYHNGVAYEAGYTYLDRTPHTPWGAAGVSKATYQHYAEEYGGTPQFNSRGEYAGLIPEPFDNSTDHQNSGPYER